MSKGWRSHFLARDAVTCLTEHSMKHFRIVKVSLYDDDTGGPASSQIETIERKCMKCGLLDEVEVNVI